MAKRRRKALRKIAPEHSDPIRIVPPYAGAGAEVVAPAASPQLTYRQGPLIASAEVFTIFLGCCVEVRAAERVFRFHSDEQTHPSARRIQCARLRDQAWQAQRYNRAFVAGVGQIRTGQCDSEDAAERNRLQRAVSTGFSSTLYFVYLPPGVKAIQGGSGSCTAFCGYHKDVNGEIFYAVMPYRGCSGCIGGYNPLMRSLQRARTNSAKQSPIRFPDQAGMTIPMERSATFVPGKPRRLATYTVQLEWFKPGESVPLRVHPSS